ncbi:MAG: DUF3147 family protein [Ktedonobacteraceae bacterium]
MILEYLARFLVGGVLVCVFAFISEICMPKQFAGIFSAAPSVLLAGLIITLLAKGAPTAALTAQGAIAGAVGMIVFCLVAHRTITRYRALPGSSLALVSWFFVSFAVFVLLHVMLAW